MKSRDKEDEDLQISSFIKEPASLKLLILAGTNIKSAELSTVNKCTGLIKLDLSNNFLETLPLKFASFQHMKILYLHENQLTRVEIKCTQLEYVSLFKNPIRSDEYRKELVEHNDSLLGIDLNAVTDRERAENSINPIPAFSEIKWPIVEISSTLEKEDDYLNMLKAEIFVIANVHRRTVRIESMERIMQGFNGARKYERLKEQIKAENEFERKSVIKAAIKWKEFTLLKRKLRAILSAKNKEFLIDNNIDRRKRERSHKTSQIINEYLRLLRIRMRIRPPLERQMKIYKEFLPAFRKLQEQYLGFTENRDYLKNPIKMYFKESEADILAKVCLFAKKLFFKQKDYDLCDEFGHLFCETNRKFYIIREHKVKIDGKVWLRDSIRGTSGLVLRQLGVNRFHVLYTKKGHKKIGIKSSHNVYKMNEKEREKIEMNDRKLSYLFNKYDKLIEYDVKNYKILKTVFKILRFINSGNASSILSTETAYFQTEVVFDDDKNEQQKQDRVKVHIGLSFFTQRVISANIIQRFWRKKLSQKKSINIVNIIREERASNLIRKWFRNLIFAHRQTSLKFRSYYPSTSRTNEKYLHFDIYMNMPNPTNFLRFLDPFCSKNEFYDVVHKNTQISIVQIYGRKWIKIIYEDIVQANKAQINFHKFTYCYCYGFFIKLFSENELKNTKEMALYEKNLLKFYKINVELHDLNEIKRSEIKGNDESFFVWSEVDCEKHSKEFEKFEQHNTNLSIFIYNKHKRPLKVSCEFYWSVLPSLYQGTLPAKRTKEKFAFSHDSTQKEKQVKEKLSSRRESLDDKLFFGIETNAKGNNRKLRNFIDQPKKSEKSNRSSLKKFSVDSKNGSFSKSHRTRIISEYKLQKLSETLNIRGK